MVTVTTSATWGPEPQGGGCDNLRGAGSRRVARGALDAESRGTGYAFEGRTGEAGSDGHGVTVGAITYDDYRTGTADHCPARALPVPSYTSNQQQPPGWHGLTSDSDRPIRNDQGDIAELCDSGGDLRARYACGNAAA